MENVMELKSSLISQKLDGLLIQPFPIQFDCNDYHFIIFFEGHPEYESIEAMIQERDGMEPYIRAIITCHDKTQTDHINDRKIYDEYKALNHSRKVCYSPMKYTNKKMWFKKHFKLEFKSYKGEDIILDFSPASKPSAKYADLIDPLGHSKSTSLPVMRPEKSTLIGAKSKVSINGIQYKIPVKIHVPIFFTGLKGFYSELFSIGIIRAVNRNITLIKLPAALVKGEHWVYRSNNKTYGYRIEQVHDDNISVVSENEKVNLEIHESVLELKAVYVYASCNNCKNAEFSICFSPSIIMQNNKTNSIQKRISEFTISINDHTSLITGTIDSEAGVNSLKLHLKPLQPEWAKERSVLITIDSFGSDFKINTVITNSFE
jgi:hypothetical protein